MRPVVAPSRLRGPIVGLVAAAAAGLLFGVGLVVAGMTVPAKVVGFLDPTRGWDPSLGFVMASAIAVNMAALSMIQRRSAPWLDTRFHLPTRRDLDVGLVAGSAVFGVGWGLGGLCPGPGLVSAAAGSVAALQFVAAMLVGMLAQHGWSRR